MAFLVPCTLQASEPLTGHITGFRLDQAQPTINAHVDLTMDIEWLFRASTLMRDPVVNCGLRVSNIRGTVAFQHQGQRHSVTVTPGNAGNVTVVSLGFAMLYRQDITHDTVLRCDPGVIATAGREPFNVASGLNWSRTFCRFPRQARGPMPMRLDHDWCLNGLGGEYLDAEAARALYGEGTSSWASSASLVPRILSATVGVTQLVVDEQAQLRAEAASERDAEAARSTQEEEISPYERLSRRAGETAGATATDRLSRLGQRDDAPDGATSTPPQDRLGTMLTRVENRRAAEEARSRLAALAVERGQLVVARDEARAACEAGRPIPPSATRRPLPTLTLGVICLSDECYERQRRADQTLGQREAERRERERREREERAQLDAARLADYERALATFERALPACLARADEAFQISSRRIDAAERTARDVIARLD